MTSWNATPGECRALAKVVQLIRNRSGGAEWHLPGIEDALNKAREVAPFPDLCLAAVTAAREPSNRTPAVIALDGPHWRQGEVAPRFAPPDPWTLCNECGLTESECHRKQLGSPDKHRYVSRGHAQQRAQGTASAKAAAIAETKQAQQAVKELVCPHGARPGVKCAICDAERARPTAEPTTEPAPEPARV